MNRKTIVMFVVAFLGMTSVASGSEIIVKPGDTIWGTCRYLKRARLLPVGMTTKECEGETLAANPSVEPIKLMVGTKVEFPDRVEVEVVVIGEELRNLEVKNSALQAQLVQVKLDEEAARNRLASQKEQDIAEIGASLDLLRMERDRLQGELDSVLVNMAEARVFRFAVIMLLGGIALLAAISAVRYRSQLRAEKISFWKAVEKLRILQAEKEVAEKMCEDLDRLWEEKFLRARKGIDFTIQDKGDPRTVFFPFDDLPYYRMPCGTPVRFKNIQNHLRHCQNSQCRGIFSATDPNAIPEGLKEDGSQRLAS